MQAAWTQIWTSTEIRLWVWIGVDVGLHLNLARITESGPESISQSGSESESQCGSEFGSEFGLWHWIWIWIWIWVWIEVWRLSMNLVLNLKDYIFRRNTFEYESARAHVNKQVHLNLKAHQSLSQASRCAWVPASTPWRQSSRSCAVKAAMSVRVCI